jgi:hypothetical protein
LICNHFYEILFPFLATLFITSSLFGQNGVRAANLAYKDSSELISVWKQFKRGFASKDTRALESLSLKQVECNMSLIIKPHNIDSGIRYIPIDSFLFQAYKNLENSTFWSLQVYQINGIHPPNLKYQKGQILKIYQVWYDSPKLNTPEDLEKGQLYAFEFVKIDGRFKFFGLTSTP